jgi:hypothetical protein
MNQFGSVGDAKEFLVRQIVDEARLEGVPLSGVETKMRYFSGADGEPLSRGEVLHC